MSMMRGKFQVSTSTQRAPGSQWLLRGRHAVISKDKSPWCAMESQTVSSKHLCTKATSDGFSKLCVLFNNNSFGRGGHIFKRRLL